jgi:DNA-binding HxlR family transcriptional regulator
MSESVLAARLAELVREGIFVRDGVEYRLSPRGLELWELLVAQVEWERAWSPAGALQPALTHLVCGAVAAPVLMCAREDVPVSARDTTVSLEDPAAAAGVVPPRARRRSTKPDPAHPELALNATLAVLGDRWSAVLTGLALTGMRRFSEFERAMGAAPTVLTDRLRRLVAEGVLARDDRAEYRLTPKGLALFPTYALIVKWAGGDGPLVIRHGRHVLQPRLACGACGAALTRREVSYRPAAALRS